MINLSKIRFVIYFFILGIFLLFSEMIFAQEIATVQVSGTYLSYYNVFDLSGNKIDSFYTKNTFQIPTGNYIIELNGTTIEFHVKKGNNLLPVSTVNLNGSSNNYFSIFKENDNTYKPLSTIYTKDGFDIFPGTWTLSVNGSYITNTFEPGKNDFYVSVVNLNGSKNNYYSVYDNEEADGKALETIYTKNKLDLFPGTWTLKVNGSYKTNKFRPGVNDFFVSVVNLKGSKNNYYSIYESEQSSKPLETIYTKENLDIFPGTWTLRVNGSYISNTFKPGINEFSVAVINLNGSANNYYSIFDNEDASGNALETIYTKDKLDLFPGKWTITLNESKKTQTFIHGINNCSVAVLSFKCVSRSNFYVYDKEFSSSPLFNIDSNKKIDIFPGSYFIEVNDQSKNVLLYKGENIFDCNIVRISSEPPKNSVVSGCVTFKNEPMNNSTIMIIQSGQYHKQSKLDTKGCFSIENISDETPFSIFIRSNK